MYKIIFTPSVKILKTVFILIIFNQYYKLKILFTISIVGTLFILEYSGCEENQVGYVSSLKRKYKFE